ncbi:hypothetical protein QNI16_35490 [Cytophagaceae bacterium YF14B1]|uniref:Uncharacterized protein n=1 Tax=Xanthocytophaga flava TaxID=3048013 RepID=A0AAE3QYF4_9BACT|nr:hypothetical protein [Xanthocytophaga flavus]MDJ1485840.1 hypothetical protein [Xanthocytophaga flavus]
MYILSRILFVALFCTLWANCQFTQSTNTTTVKDSVSDEAQIINTLLPYIQESDTTWRNRHKRYLEYGRTYDEFPYTNQQIDSFIQEIDTSTLYIQIYDSLKMSTLYGKDKYLQNIINDFKGQFYNVDTIYQPLAQKVLDFTKILPLDTNHLIAPLPYNLEYTSNRHTFQQEDGRMRVSLIQFSYIALNTPHTLACIYVDYFCGRTCGENGFYFFKKVKGKWYRDGEKRTGIR